MTGKSLTLLALNVSLFLQLAGLTGAVINDPYIGKRNRRILLLSIVIIVGLLVDEQAGIWFDMHAVRMGRLVTSIFNYCAHPVIIVLFIELISEDKKPWILIVFNTIVFMTAFYTDIAFTITEENKFYRGPLGFTCHIVSGVLLIWDVIIAARKYWDVESRFSFIPLIISQIIFAATWADTRLSDGSTVSFLTVAVVSACIFYYIWLHLMFVKEHEQALRAEQRIQIMISQIQPHFLFNTLSTIQALCRIDPDKAFRTTEMFGKYLRQNIESLGEMSLIPFEKELEHTKVYAGIEQIRFSTIELLYKIEDSDFSVPALTLQPIVENSIRHGVRIRKHGLITVRAWKEEDCHTIVVEDNGKGFDVKAVESADNSHIGIRNVRERLESMCGGTMEIESVPDEGTTVTIRIPDAG